MRWAIEERGAPTAQRNALGLLRHSPQLRVSDGAAGPRSHPTLRKAPKWRSMTCSGFAKTRRLRASATVLPVALRPPLHHRGPSPLADQSMSLRSPVASEHIAEIREDGGFIAVFARRPALTIVKADSNSDPIMCIAALPARNVQGARLIHAAGSSFLPNNRSLTVPWRGGLFRQCRSDPGDRNGQQSFCARSVLTCRRYCGISRLR